MQILQSLNPFKSSALGKVPSSSEYAFPSVIGRINDDLANGASTLTKFYETDNELGAPSAVIKAMNVIMQAPAKYTDATLAKDIDRRSAVPGYEDTRTPFPMWRLAAWLALSFQDVFPRILYKFMSTSVTAAAVYNVLRNNLQVPQGTYNLQEKMNMTKSFVDNTVQDFRKFSITIDKAQTNLIAAAIRYFEIEASILRQYEMTGVANPQMAAELTAYREADQAWRSWASNFPPDSRTSISPAFPTTNYGEKESSESAAAAYTSKVHDLYRQRDLAQAALTAWREYFQGTSVESFMAGTNPNWPTGYSSTLDNAAIAAFRGKINSMLTPFTLLAQNFRTYQRSSYPNATVANQIYDLLMAEGAELREIQNFMSLSMDARLSANTTNSGTTLKAIQAALQSWAKVRDDVGAYLNQTLQAQENAPAIADQIISTSIAQHIIRLRELRQRLEQSEGAVTAMGRYIGQSLQAQASSNVQFPQGYTASAEVTASITAHKGNLASLFKQLEDETNTAAMYLNFLEKAAQGYASLDEILQAQPYPPQLADILRTISANMRPRAQDAVQCIDKLAPVIAYLENVDGHLSPQLDADILRAQAVLQALYAKIKMWEDVDRAWRDWLNSGADNILNQKPTFPDGYSRSDSDTAAGKMQQEIGGALDALYDALKTAQAQPPPQNGAEQQQQIIDCSEAIKRAEQLVAFIQATEANQRAAVTAGYASYNSAGALQADLEKAWAVLSALYAKRDELQSQLPCPTCTPGGTTTSTAAVTDSSDNKGAIALGLAALAGLAYWYSKKQAR